jgi:hypothetical protein
MLERAKRNEAMLLTFLVSLGCSSAPTQTARAPARPVSLRASSTPTQTGARDAPPQQVLAEADQAYDSQWGVTRGGHFDEDRQIAVLQQAILLYTQFLERAAGKPEMEAAVRKSRERIADAQQTIIFLGGSAGATR